MILTVEYGMISALLSISGLLCQCPSVGLENEMDFGSVAGLPHLVFPSFCSVISPPWQALHFLLHPTFTGTALLFFSQA